MKRRGFFGFAAGAAVAGPSMAKQAISSAVNELAALQIGGGAVPPAGYALSSQAVGQGGLIGSINQIGRAQDALARIAGLTKAQRAKYKAQTYVSSLDPDIASYRSISLAAKIDWQKERNLDANINGRKSWWEKIASGFDPYMPSEDDIL